MVITKAKNLSDYILTITQKSPKQFRFSLVGRLQNYALDIVELLYEANDVFAQDDETRKERLSYQHKAMTRLKLLSYVAQVSSEQGAIQFKQYEQIVAQVTECERLLGAWMASARKKMG